MLVTGIQISESAVNLLYVWTVPQIWIKYYKMQACIVKDTSISLNQQRYLFSIAEHTSHFTFGNLVVTHWKYFTSKPGPDTICCTDGSSEVLWIKFQFLPRTIMRYGWQHEISLRNVQEWYTGGLTTWQGKVGRDNCSCNMFNAWNSLLTQRYVIPDLMKTQLVVGYPSRGNTNYAQLLNS